MEYKLYEAANMVAMEKDGKWGLFYFEDEQESLIPVKFAQNLSYLHVYDKQNLVVTPEGVFTLFGEKIVETTSGAEVITAATEALIVTKGDMYEKTLTIWNGKEVLMQTSCSDFRYSDRYLALKYNTIWSLFEINGTLIDEGAFDAGDVEIHRDFIVTISLGRQGLYSLKKKDFLKENQLKILCSDSCDLALCAQIGSTALSVYSQGRWHSIPIEGEFDLVSGIDYMFYVKRGKRYFIYDDDVQRFMRYTYPDGVDFISCDKNGLLMIANRGKVSFYKR